MSNMDNQNTVGNSSSFAKGLLIGGLIGAAAALLFAPKPGRDLRSDLSEKITVVSDKTKDVASVVSSKATDLAKTVTSKTADVAKTVSESKDNIVSSVTKASADIVDEAAKADKEVMDATAQAAEETQKQLNATS
ncbi:YtxH domain-containing protein [Paenibacillus terrae]